MKPDTLEKTMTIPLCYIMKHLFLINLTASQLIASITGRCLLEVKQLLAKAVNKGTQWQYKWPPYPCILQNHNQ